jgi:hypothetical protein
MSAVELKGTFRRLASVWSESILPKPKAETPKYRGARREEHLTWALAACLLINRSQSEDLLYSFAVVYATTANII